MINENIAKLTGLLNFQVDLSGLHRFNASLNQVEQRMKRMSAQADAFAKKLGVAPKERALKQDASVRHNLNRELQLETAVAKAKRYTFAAELAQQKLQFAGAKQNAFFATQAIKDKQATAVADAKAHKANVERLKAQGQEIKNTATLAATQARQTGLEQKLAQQQVKTSIMQQKHVQSLTATQRIELALNEARERGMRAAHKFQASQQQAKLRDQRQAEAHQQRTERFNWAASRQSHWEANRNSPAKSADFGLGSFSIALGVAGAALYALTSAVAYANERVKLRQEGASTAESLNTALETAGGKNPLNQKRARESFIELSNKYGQEISVESAKVFANFVQTQIAIGKTLDQALKIYEDQSAVFRAAALDKEQQKRAAYQLGQIRAKGKPEGSDVNDLFDAVGGPVASSIRQAAATRLKFTGKPEEQAGWFKKQVTKGNILAKDFDQGMANYLGANQDVLAKQMKSIEADQTRSDNQKFMNEAQLNSSQELKDVIHERIEAERQLNQALQPVNIALAQFDVGLTKLATFMLNFAAGNDANGNKKSEQQRMQDRMSTGDTSVDTAMVGTHDYSAVNGNVQRQGGPIGKFYNWLFDVPDHSKGDADKLKVPTPSSLTPVVPPLDTSKLDTSQLPKRLEDLMQSPLLQGMAKMAVEADYNSPQATGVMTSTDAQRASTVTNNTTTNNKTITNSPVINVSVTSGKDIDDNTLAHKISVQVRESLGKAMQITNAQMGTESQ